MNTFFVENYNGKIQLYHADRKEAVFICYENNEEVIDSIRELEAGVFEWIRKIPVAKSRINDFRNLIMGIRIPGAVNFFMIPCINYNGNHWGNGKEPKGLSMDGMPWKFASHRSGVPGGMFAQNDEIAVGIWGDIDNPMGFSCYIETTQNNELTLNLRFPEEESPAIYCARDCYEEKCFYESCWTEEDYIELKAMIITTERKRAYDYHFFLDTAWNYLREECKPVRQEQELWNLGIDFIINSAFFREKGFSGFSMGLTWEEGKWVQKRDYLEIGWVGQNASLAVSLLYQYAVNGDETAGRLGIEILDCWAAKAVLSNGLFRCRFDKIIQDEEGINLSEERNDAANLYSVVEEYLEAYVLLQELGISRENYREIALGVCDFAVKVQKEDGRLGKAWFNSGTCSDSDGTVGCYMAKALCIAYKTTKNPVYLEAARASYHYYFNEFMSTGFTTAGALDTYCVDKESAIPLLGTALSLYEFTGEGSYLEEAVSTGYYLATWQYHYNIRFKQGTILGQMGYKTRGGTAVSVQHHHIDCYGLAFYKDWLILGKLTGNPVWKERADAVWNNSLYNISNGNLIVKGQKRPRGSQDEGFLQTRWHTKKGEYFGVSEWLVVWNTAFRLKILRKENLASKREFDKDIGKI